MNVNYVLRLLEIDMKQITSLSNHPFDIACDASASERVFRIKYYCKCRFDFGKK